MNSIWTILIDNSGSMGDGFSGNVKTAKGLVERGNWQTKLDAAKDILYQQVQGLFETEIALISFSSGAELLYRGKNNDIDLLKNIIYSIVPDSGTNIASGLLLALDELSAKDYNSVSILIITDGLSNEGDPMQAARKVVRQYPYARISTILIDVTEEGERIARQISINGDVRYAHSFQELQENTRNVGLNALRYSIHTTEGKINEIQSHVFPLVEKKSMYQRELETFESPDAPRIPIEQIKPIQFAFDETSPVEFDIDYLDSKVVPYLKSLENLQGELNQITHQPNRVRLHSITKYSPVTASVSGIAQALEIVERMVNPWKREHAKRIAILEEKEKELQIKKVENEILESKINHHNDNVKTELLEEELRLKKAQAERMELENEKIRLDLMKEKIRFVKEILNEFGSNLSDEEKTIYTIKLMKPLEELISNPLTTRLVLEKQ